MVKNDNATEPDTAGPAADMPEMSEEQLAAVDEGCAAIMHCRVLHVPFIGISISTIGVSKPPSTQILVEGGLYTPMVDITQRGWGVVMVPARLGRRHEHGHGRLLLQVRRA